MSESNSVRESGRQIKGGSLQLVAKKAPGRANVPFLDETKNEIAYRWLQRGQSTREISRGLRINDRAAVERAIHEVLSPKLEPKPFLLRRAA